MARVCILEQAYFSWDRRVDRQADALVSMGHDVDRICMRRPGEPATECVNGVRILRIPLQKPHGHRLNYLLVHAAFLALATTLIAIRHLRRRYGLVQVHARPDTLVFAAIVPKIFGARVVLDLEECIPEFFSTKFDIPQDSLVCRAVAQAEQLAIRFSDAAMTCTDQQKEVFVSRGAPPSKVAVVLNSADESVFDGQKYPHVRREPERFTLISHGSIEPSYGLDTVIRAIAILKDEIPWLRLAIYGVGNILPKLQNLVYELDVARNVTFKGFVPMEELLEAISNADAGVVAMKRDAFRDLTHCNKMYELIVMNVPVLMSRVPSVESYFSTSCFQYFEADNPEDLARAIRELVHNPSLAAELVSEATRTNHSYRWTVQRAKYLDIIEPLISLQWNDQAPSNTLGHRSSNPRF